MANLGKKSKSLIKSTISQARGAKGGPRYDGSSGKKFQGSTQYTGRTIGSGTSSGSASSSGGAALLDPRNRPRRVPRPLSGGAKTPLSL